MRLFNFLTTALCALFLLGLSNCGTGDRGEKGFSSDWATAIDRPWAGPDIWLNPLQAWYQRDGQLRCEVSGGDRSAVLLTHELGPNDGPVSMRVHVAAIQGASEEAEEVDPDQAVTSGTNAGQLDPEGWVGFQIGLKGEFDDFRDDAVLGRGFCAGIQTDGRLFIGSLENDAPTLDVPVTDLVLQLEAGLQENGLYQVKFSVFNKAGQSLAAIERTVHPSWLQGLVALTCSQQASKPVDLSAERPPFDDVPALGRAMGGNTTYAFRDWSVSGDKFIPYPERAFGPILWTQYTLSGDVLKMSVQMAPVGNGEREVGLEIDGKTVESALIDNDGRNAIFKRTGWDSSKDHPYVATYEDEKGYVHRYEGVITADPTAQSTLKVASLSCVDDVGFPHNDIVANLQEHDPDLYAFHGDQIYERVGGYGVERSNKLDYLRKWYIWGWSFRELFRNRPAVIIPDDHDVFHGNLWGEGGKRANIELGWGYNAQDDGGYKEPPDFVNMVHRTQTSHLPDPYDPTPVLNDISVYFTEMIYGDVSFAILGDRQWKSAPKALLPKAEIENGWPQKRSWDAKTEAYHPDAELLGDRQMAFLNDWVADWAPDVQFKAVISQSPFCNVATLPADIYHDKYVPSLKRYRIGEYPPDDRPVADFDSNGWPQNKRDDALRTIRKSFALHLVGDQHLGSTGRYGIDEFDDAGYWITCPAVANIWPRRWFPAQAPTGGLIDGQPRYAGPFEDGFGNKITVKAVANPHDLDRQPDRLYDKAPGYSIIVFHKDTRRIDLAVWPRWAGPQRPAPDNEPFPGWPIVIEQQDNYGAAIAGYLPDMNVPDGAYIQLFNEKTGELVYAIRPPAGSFSAKVFDDAVSYSIKMISPDGKVEEKGGLRVE